MTSKDCKEPGRYKLANKILNALVPRSAPRDYAPMTKDIKYMDIDKIRDVAVTDSAAKGVTGLRKWTMIGTHYAGREDIFVKAEHAGEVKLNATDGLWYFRWSVRSKTVDNKEHVTATSRLDVSDPKIWVQLMDQFSSDLKAVEHDDGGSWFNMQHAKGIASAGSAVDALTNSAEADLAPNDADMRLLQEVFDAMTKITLAIKRMAQELLTWRSSDSAIAREGLSRLKELVDPTLSVETLLVTPRADMTKGVVSQACDGAKEPYRKILDFYKQLVAIYELQVQKIARKDR